MTPYAPRSPPFLVLVLWVISVFAFSILYFVLDFSPSFSAVMFSAVLSSSCTFVFPDGCVLPSFQLLLCFVFHLLLCAPPIDFISSRPGSVFWLQGAGRVPHSPVFPPMIFLLQYPRRRHQVQVSPLIIATFCSIYILHNKLSFFTPEKLLQYKADWRSSHWMSSTMKRFSLVTLVIQKSYINLQTT